jgi:hypothetical protein
MKKIYLMTSVVAVAVLSQMPAARAFSPAGPNLQERLNSCAGKLFRRFRRMINDWVAGAIAYRERRVTQFALRSLSDIELKEFGAYRRNPGSDFHRCRDVNVTTRR